MNFNKKNYGFTLAEIVVSVSVSLILMLGVGTFITSGLKNITAQKKILDSTSKISGLYEDLQEVFSGDVRFFTGALNNDILVKNSYVFGRGNFNILASRDFDSDCLDMYSSSGNYLTGSYLVNYNFSPYEGLGGDIFYTDGYIYNSGSLNVKFYDNSITYGSQTLSGFFENISGVFENNTDIYISDSKKHGVYKIPKSGFLNDIPELIVGAGVYGYEDLPKNGKQTYLNNPSGLAIVGGNLFISDSGNNRVVYYDLGSGKLDLFLDKTNGIYNPTGLYFDETDKKFYIANAGRGEIYEFSINSTVPTDLTLNYENQSTYSEVNKITLTPVGIGNITGFYSSGSFTFDNGGNIPVLTGSLNSGVLELDINTTNIYTSNGTIKINPFSYSGSGSVYFDIKYLNGGSDVGNTSSVGFTIGDGDLLTKKDNILKIYEGYNYPTGVFKDSGKICINDFGLRKKRCLDNTLDDLTGYNFQRFIFDKSYLRLKDYKTNSSVVNGVRSVDLKINYYKSFDCSDENQNVESTMIYKKKFQ